jgi:hypothetical protein
VRKGDQQQQTGERSVSVVQTVGCMCPRLAWFSVSAQTSDLFLLLIVLSLGELTAQMVLLELFGRLRSLAHGDGGGSGRGEWGSAAAAAAVRRGRSGAR